MSASATSGERRRMLMGMLKWVCLWGCLNYAANGYAI
jgi:hypothetical protein